MNLISSAALTLLEETSAIISKKQEWIAKHVCVISGDRERVMIKICALLAVAIVDFEGLVQDERLSVREGQSLQLCVALVSGSLPYEQLFTISTLTTGFAGRKKRGTSPLASMIILCCCNLRLI